jgi:hypothetical protein
MMISDKGIAKWFCPQGLEKPSMKKGVFRYEEERPCVCFLGAEA